ncbi:prohead protease/major capsid protein fusion protein [Aestuariivirga sp.]|uniref:prohead protease/major capsid protein fusion protein n=1 Tax=Aestuariivirga sp. TaxID=2650926 RepID=UPI00391917BF
MNAPNKNFDAILTREAVIVSPRVETGKAPVAIIRASTGADVERRDYLSGEPYTERLEISEGAVDLSYLNSGQAHLLADHEIGSTAAVLGTITKAWIKDRELYAEVIGPIPGTAPRLDESWSLIKQGILKNVSIGYRISTFKESRESGKLVRTATKWTPHEISMVALGADLSAMVVSARSAPFIKHKDKTMTETDTISTALHEDDQALARNMSRLAGLNREQEDDVVNRAINLEHARGIILSKAAANSDAIQITTARSDGYESLDAPGVFASVAGEAVFSRLNPKHRPSDAARPYINMSMADLARITLERAGRSLPLNRTPGALIERALHTTSDFPQLLVSAASRSLRDGYIQAANGIRTVAKERNHRDFRGLSRVILDHSGFELKKVNEAGEFTRGTMEEARSSYRLETFGRVFGISRQALVNDDLGAFDDMARKLGMAAANFEAQQMVDLLTDNSSLGPTMDDSVVLFHSSHGNVSASGAGPDVTTLSVARKAMREQTGPGGGIIGVAPAYLVVSPENETAGEQVLAQLTATQLSNVNPFSGSLRLVVEPRLTGKRWYIVADPNMVDGLSYAYLEGEAGPQVFIREGFDVDGTEFKVRLDFGCGFEDWRGWYSNAGQ